MNLALQYRSYQLFFYKQGFKMISRPVDNVHIESHENLITPQELKSQLPITVSARKTVEHSRKQIEDILDHRDKRIFVVVGPCSIHNVESALEYARKLKLLSAELSDCMLLVMRVYFEKPRTTVGWKGLINDPYMDDSFKIADGLKLGRQLLLDILELGLPTATEALDPISPQYIQDLISWSAIGARTTESQTHREMASGLSSSVGFKNGTDGSLTSAVNALKSVAKKHRFLGINSAGEVAVVTTRGNHAAHIVLRGGNGKPNYDAISISNCEKQLEIANLSTNIMVDCSHANSNKDHTLQPRVIENIAEQIADGNRSIIGLMMESNLEAGNQKMTPSGKDLQYGVSVTDACMSWNKTQETLAAMAKRIRGALLNR